MATTHAASARNTGADAITALVNAGATNPNGRLILRTAGDVEVATLNMAADAFGDASGGVSTAGTITGDSAATGGTTTKYTMEDRDNNIIFEGSVGSGSGDIDLNNNVIAVGVQVDVTAFTYTFAN